MFENVDIEFDECQTTTFRRVQCLKKIPQKANQLQKRIGTIYHENVSMNKESLRKNCNSIYQTSKEIFYRKLFAGLINALQARIRISFTNFVLNMLKYIVDDYRLETLTKLSSTGEDYENFLEFIDYSSLRVIDE